MKTSFLKLFFAVYGVAVYGMDGGDDIGNHASPSNSHERESISRLTIDTVVANQIRDVDVANQIQNDALFAQQLADTPERRLKNESKVPQNRFWVKILMRSRILGLQRNNSMLNG